MNYSQTHVATLVIAGLISLLVIRHSSTGAHIHEPNESRSDPYDPAIPLPARNK